MVMLAEEAANTNNGISVNPLNVAVPIKTRTLTDFSICSVATENRSPESRDAACDESREVDGARDADVDGSSHNVEVAGGYGGKCVMAFPLCAIRESRSGEEVPAVNLAPSKSLLPKEEAPPSKDATLNRNDDDENTNIRDDSRGACCSWYSGFDEAIQYFYSSIELGAEKISSSCASTNYSKASNNEEGRSLLDNSASLEAKDLLTETKNDAADTCEPNGKETTGAAIVNNDAEAAESAKDHDLSKLQQQSIQSKTSQDTSLFVKTHLTSNSTKTKGTIKSTKAPGTTVESKNAQEAGTLHTVSDLNEDQARQNPRVKSSCCFMSVFACSDYDPIADEGRQIQKVSLSPRNLDDIIGDTLNITTSKVHILDTFSDDNTYGESTERPVQQRGIDSERPLQRLPVDSCTPRAQNLLNEIDHIEKSLFNVRRTASKEKVSEIEKRQDPFTKKMASIKQHLMDQQTLLKSIPDQTFHDAKKEYYHAISHAIMMNAEVETRRADLELKKIKLESMKVEKEMDYMMAFGDTFDDTIDSLDQSLTNKVQCRGRPCGANVE